MEIRVKRGRMSEARGFSFKKLFVSVSLIALSACGGGGGGGSSAASPPAPPGPVAPVPVSLPSQGVIYTVEYNNSFYLAQIRADGAYQKGATGNTINIAIIDGGIVDTNPELSGKVLVHIDTTGLNPGGGAPDHATAIASLAAANRDNSGVMGVAYNAHLYDLNVFQPGVGPGATPFANDSDIARALKIVAGRDATYTGLNARIINMSLGGSTPFAASVVTELKENALRDKVIVIAAGNGGAAQPEPTARIAADPTLQSNMIIVGTVTSGNVIASFSNRAGAYAQYYLVAPGVNLPAQSDTGGYVAISGTSASTPIVSGALAIVAEAFPYLSGADLVKLLKVTATDLGDPGVDPIYGYGLINLQGALSPVGPLSVPTGSTVSGSSTPLGSVLVTTGSVIGALQNGTLIALDSFNRAFDVGTASLAGVSKRSTLFDRNSGVGGAPVGTGIGTLLNDWQVSRGAQAFLTAGTTVSGTSDTYAVALTDNVIGAVFRNARPSQLMAVQGLEPTDEIGQPLFAVTADNSVPQTSFFTQGISAVAYGFRGKGYFASVAYGTGGNIGSEQSSMLQASLAFEAAGGEWGVSTSLLNEDNTVLGGYTSGSNLKGAYGRTTFTTFTANYPLNSWNAGFSYTLASLDRGALATGLDLNGVKAEAASFTLSGPAGLREGDILGFRMAQPLRASGGSVEAYLPVGRTFAGDIIRAPQRLGIEPDGRELDFELGYTTPLPEIRFGRRADLRLNAFYVRQPGNMQNAADALGGAVQFTLGW